MAIVHVKSIDEFKKEVLDANNLVVVDFWAEWCGPCRMLGPVFEKLSEEMEDVKFVKVNVDEANELAASQNIRSIPTLMVFKDGEMKNQTMGAMAKDQLRTFIESSN